MVRLYKKKNSQLLGIHFSSTLVAAFPLKVCSSSGVCVRTVTSNSLRSHGLYSARLLCLWDFPGKNTGVGCHFLLQGIFPTQGLNPCLLHWQLDTLPVSHQGSLVHVPKAYIAVISHCYFSTFCRKKCHLWLAFRIKCVIYCICLHWGGY